MSRNRVEMGMCGNEYSANGDTVRGDKGKLLHKPFLAGS